MTEFSFLGELSLMVLCFVLFNKEKKSEKKISIRAPKFRSE